jgi:hypothetical protein
MSIELVKAEIAKFLKGADPAVLCLRGKWGVGKTHAWNEQLELAQSKGQLGMKTYAYVSLFGLTSLDSLKFAVFENSQNVENGIRVANLDTLNEYLAKMPGWRKLVKALGSGNWLSKFVDRDAVQGIMFASVRNHLICIDDFERRGEGLEPKDVLGLISLLREQRKCKVALILNDEHLDEKARQDFETHLEKVVDVSLVYESTPALAAKIGVSGINDPSFVTDRCIALGITNIRTIKRAVRLVNSLEPKLTDFDPEVLRTAVQSLVLFCWCRDEPEQAPPLNYLENKKLDLLGLGRVAPTNKAGPDQRQDNDNSPKWSARLRAYGYMWTDDFDQVLIEVVRKGYVDDAKLQIEARKLSAKFVKGRAEGSMEDAWRRIDDSLYDNDNIVLGEIRQALLNNIEYVSPMTLNGTVNLFKRLGRDDEASDLIAGYVVARGDEPKLFDLDSNPFQSQIDDPDVRAAFDQKAAEPRDIPDFVTLLASVKDGWSLKILDALASATIDDYKRAFKSFEGEQHRSLVHSALQFTRVMNANPAMDKITEKAIAALQAIAKESPLNAIRVARFGVAVEPTTKTDDDSLDATKWVQPPDHSAG